VASVISGGLRARRHANLHQGLSASLRQAALISIAVYLVQFPCQLVWVLATWARGGFDYSFPLYGQPYVLLSAVVAVILAATWSGRRWLAAVPTVVTLAATLAYFIVTRSASAGTASLLLAVIGLLTLAVLVPLTTRAVRPPRSLLWFVCLPIVVNALEAVVSMWRVPIDHVFPFIRLGHAYFSDPYISYLSLIPVGVAVCWLVTDVRPLIGVVLAFMLPNTVLVVVHVGRSGVRFFTGSAVLGPTVSQPIWPTLIAVAVPLALACALVWLFRHRAKTIPPTVG
jgi:hypothetical protein